MHLHWLPVQFTEYSGIEPAKYIPRAHPYLCTAPPLYCHYPELYLVRAYSSIGKSNLSQSYLQEKEVTLTTAYKLLKIRVKPVTTAAN
jgi:hypothetical protein